jgi:hypothetical protein
MQTGEENNFFIGESLTTPVAFGNGKSWGDQPGRLPVRRTPCSVEPLPPREVVRAPPWENFRLVNIEEREPWVGRGFYSFSSSPQAPSPRAASPRRPKPETLPPPGRREFTDFVALVARPGDTFSSLAAEHFGDASLSWFVAEFNGIDTLEPGAALVMPRKVPNPGGLTPGGYQTVPVLVYHKFSRSVANPMTVRESDFEAQMRFLKEKGYHVTRWNNSSVFELPAPMPKVGRDHHRRWVAVQYDIAFRSSESTGTGDSFSPISP